MGSYKRLYYMNYYKDGEKYSGGGILKLVPRKTEDESSGTSLSVQLSGPVQLESVISDILLISDRMQKNWGQVDIVSGMGRTRLQDLDVLMGQMEEQVRLRLVLDENSYIECILREGTWTETRNIEDLETAEVHLEERILVEDEQMEGAPRVRNVESMRMKGDKWHQLWEVLPHIRPFEDDREYLRLDLKDMIILPGLYYRLVDNSFLLHGYYNYGHLVLTKVMRRGQEKICLGVPGNYYEKEKQVAVMFGFESFEPKTEPAEEGDFGYYMIGAGI